MKESQILTDTQIDNQDKYNLGFINRITGSNKVLSSEETREILTPFAFTVDESLFGISIARPWRRGFALLIDLFFIALLSQAPGELLALLIALTLFRLGSLNTTKKNQKNRLRYRFLKFMSALIIFVMLLETLPSLFSQVDSFNRNVERAEQIRKTTPQLPVNSLINSIASPDNNVHETPKVKEALKINGNLASFEYDDDTRRYDENPTLYKGFAWLKGLIEDLGIGFGWAAFYFTMFTAIWFGQTPGKKLLRIRVLQLDGTALSVWDSFGRYGGYGAGIATELLGFAQIYWDPNRQAIHDKISATIVIYCGKK